MSNKLQRSLADAQQFLRDVLAAPSLAHDYYETGQKARRQTRPASLLEWLSIRGYNTTPTHILHALEHLRDTRLSYWAGVYGDAILEKPGEAASGGPPLVVIDDETVLLDSVPISDFQFTNRSLSWGRGNSRSAGSLRFDEMRLADGPAQAPGSGFGKVFSGSLVQNQCAPGAVAVAYSGRIGPIAALPLDNWSGAYTIRTGQSPGIQAMELALVVQDRHAVFLEGTPIRNFSYCSVGHLLSWGLDYNTTAGCLVFGNMPVSANQAGTGVSGTIQTSDDDVALACKGKLSPPETLSSWVGIYGQTLLEEAAGHYADGPELAILVGGQVNLNGRSLQHVHYDANTHVLEWPVSGNGTAGQIAFQCDPGPAIAGQDGRAGKHFRGTFQHAADGPAFVFSGIPGRPYSGGGGFQEAALLKAAMEKSRVMSMISRITLPYRQTRPANWSGTKAQWSGERIPARRNAGKDIETY